MATGESPITMRMYQHLVEALAVQRVLGCRSAAQAADVVRRVLIGQMGMRQFLGARLHAHTSAPAAGWAVEFDTYRNFAGEGVTDPEPTPHVAVVRDGPNDHLMYNGDVGFSDGAWRHCDIRVWDDKLTVRVEGTTVVDALPMPAAVFGEHVGLTSATGAAFGTHVVDNLIVRIHWSMAARPELWQLYR